MKRTILTLGIFLYALALSAHSITPISYCSTTGKVVLQEQVWSVGAGDVAHFFITKNGNTDSSNGNPVIWRLDIALSGPTLVGQGDTVSNIVVSNGQASFTISVPQATNPGGIGITVAGYQNDGSTQVYSSAPYKYTSLPSGCSLLLPAMPITFSSITAKKVSDTQVAVYFTVATVSGINVINVQISFDEGKTFVTRKVLVPSSVSAGQTFTVIINSNE